MIKWKVNTKKMGIVNKNIKKVSYKKWWKNEVFNKNTFKAYLLLTLAAFIVSISYDCFIGTTNLYPSGLPGIAKLLVLYIPWNKSSAPYLIYIFILNVPLVIFGMIKIGVRFSIKSLYFIFIQIIVNFAVEKLLWITHINLIVDYASLSKHTGYQIWIFFFFFASSILFGTAYAIVYSTDSSAGGTDFFTMYVSIKRKKSIANINKQINLIILISAMILTSLTMHKEDRISFLFGPTLFGSLVFIFFQSITTNLFYPKYEYRTLFVLTKNNEKLIHILRNAGVILNDISTWDIFNTQLDENKSEKTYKLVMSTITLLEWRKVKEYITKSDPNARIFLEKIDRISGTFTIRNNF